MDDIDTEFDGGFTIEELRAVEKFLESIQPDLEELGEGGVVEVRWSERKIIATSDEGKIKEFDFSHILHYIKEGLH
jgi:hypothetical protein